MSGTWPILAQNDRIYQQQNLKSLEHKFEIPHLLQLYIIEKDIISDTQSENVKSLWRPKWQCQEGKLKPNMLI